MNREQIVKEIRGIISGGGGGVQRCCGEEFDISREIAEDIVKFISPWLDGVSGI